MQSLNRQKNVLHLGAAFLLLFSLVLFAGCSQSPVNSEEPNQGVRLLSRVPADGTAFKVLDLFTEKVISARDGGQIALFDVVIDVPPGALDNDTLFSITIPDINVFYNQFGTNGLVFHVPVTVTMSYRDADLTGIDESTIRIAYYNEVTGQYQDVDCAVDYERQIVVAQLYHFSAYGLISDEQ